MVFYFIQKSRSETVFMFLVTEDRLVLYSVRAEDVTGTASFPGRRANI